ncbi:HEAT repeat domain-containing protein, partial [candidate division WOR-3 bacterium]|nr:HEAT repeat domain-containing protein [candidate division WOR-3 bacterium]
YGLLLSKGGDDIYAAGSRYIHHPLRPHDYRSFSQGFGMGFRPDAGGGIGFLYDTKGNDFYNAEVYTQGTSYWYSLGMLLDREGNDYYNACQYSQGAGIHLSVGILLDEGGNDHYFSRYGPSQGEGHDLAVGILIDRKGDDSYVTSGGQGVALMNSCGIFIDCEGNDLYATTEKLGQGSVKPSRSSGGIGIFIDIGGRDTYPKLKAGEDESIWSDGEYGIGIDVESGIKPEKEEFAQRDTLEGGAPVDKVFVAASLWEVAENKNRVRNARERLKYMGMEAINYIIENKMETKSGLQLRAMEELVKAHPDSIEPFLIKLIKDESKRKRGNAIWLLGKIKSEESVNPLITALSEKRNWKLRNTIINALGQIKNPSATSVIIPYLNDKKERVRITSARALGSIEDVSSISVLIESLSDPFFTVRLACENSIVALGDSAVKLLLNTIDGTINKRIPFHIISALGRLAQEQDSIIQRNSRLEIKKTLLPYLDEEERCLRAQAVKALSLFHDSDIDKLLMEKKSYETDPFVIGIYRKYVE